MLGGQVHLKRCLECHAYRLSGYAGVYELAKQPTLFPEYQFYGKHITLCTSSKPPTYQQLWNPACPVVRYLLYFPVSLPFRVGMSYLPNSMPSLGAQSTVSPASSIYCRAEHGALCQVSSPHDHLLGISCCTPLLPAPGTQGPQLCPHLVCPRGSRSLPVVWKLLGILGRQKRTKKELLKGVKIRQRTVMDREREACGGDPRDRNEERKTDKGWEGGGVNGRKVKEETESQDRKIRREREG